jgi:PPM family protein phosphatase
MTMPPDAEPEIAWLQGIRGVEGEFLLTKPVNVVGRSRGCDIVLDVPTVSRRHCEIHWTGDGWQVHATGRNGTVVGDRPVLPETPQPLQHGDVVRLGRGVALCLIRPRHTPRTTLVAAGRTDIGDRRRNEDAFLATTTIAGVADGVGGRPAGAMASKICIDLLRDADERTDLGEVVRAMNAEIRRRGARDPRSNGMASTLDAVRLVSDGETDWLRGVHVGDGYTVLQQTDGTLIWKTRPHTYSEALVAAGQLSPAEGDEHPESSRLLRAIGADEAVGTEVWHEPAHPGQRLVIFTDGLYNALGRRGVADALHRTRRHPPGPASEEFIELALRAGGNRDNVTVVVADVTAEVES